MKSSVASTLFLTAILISSLVPNEAVTSCYQGTTTSSFGDISQTLCGGTYSHCSKNTYTGLYYPYIQKIVKACTNSCTESRMSSGVAIYQISCCSTDNCNFSSTIASNKFLTVLSIMIATGLALFRLN